MKLASAILGAMTDELGARESIIKTLAPLCPDVDDEVLRDFVSRMDQEYFERFQPDAIAHHIQLDKPAYPGSPLRVIGARQTSRAIRNQHRRLRLFLRIRHDLRPALRFRPEYRRGSYIHVRRRCGPACSVCHSLVIEATQRPPRPEPQEDRRCLPRAPGEWRAILHERNRPPSQKR